MADSRERHTNNIKGSRNSKGTSRSDRLIASSDAVGSGLPANCIVMPMQILDPPEPIKKRKKKR
jgi:hypothetical protein